MRICAPDTPSKPESNAVSPLPPPPFVIGLLSALVIAASLERDLDDLVPHAHVELAAAVQDQQAADGLPLPGREQLDLLQQAAPRGQVEGGEHFPDGAVIWGRTRRREREKKRKSRSLHFTERVKENVEEYASGVTESAHKPRRELGVNCTTITLPLE